MPAFQVVSEYTPSGDQPQAIARLAQGIEDGLREQILLGVTGSGKTYTMAKVIEAVQRPTLVLAHNKILAAQLCEEFKEFFPNNAVEYFVSYYDYYQPARAATTTISPLFPLPNLSSKSRSTPCNSSMFALLRNTPKAT